MIVERLSGTLQVERSHGRFDRLLRMLKFRVGSRYYCAKKGMLTDYSSTPTIYDLITKWFKVKLAGVIHDALYKYAVDCDGHKVTRKEADDAWRAIAQHGEDSANAFQAYLGWVFLRGFGWIRWNQYRMAQ